MVGNTTGKSIPRVRPPRQPTMGMGGWANGGGLVGELRVGVHFHRCCAVAPPEGVDAVRALLRPA